MSASLETTNYKLPVYANQDTIAYIPDWNKAMRTIDTQMEMCEQKADGVSADAENLLNLYTTLSSEVQTLTTLVNNNTLKSLPFRSVSPGIVGVEIYGQMSADFAFWDGGIYARNGYIENGAVHMTSKDNQDIEFVQIATFSGNPFNITHTPDNPRYIGIVFGEAVNPTRVTDISLIKESLVIAYENSITYLYMSIHKADLNKQIFLTMSASIKMR